MKIEWVGEYHGPNPWSDAPAVVADVQMTEAEILKAAEAGTALRSLFPDWFSPSAAAAEDDGRAQPQLLLAQVTEWSLVLLNEVRGYLHDAGAIVSDGQSRVWLAFHVPEISRSALQLGLSLAFAATHPSFRKTNAETAIEEFWRYCRKRHPDYQARILMSGARASGIPVLRVLPEGKLWQYGWGARSRLFLESLSNMDGQIAGRLASNKAISKAVLTALGVPTPPSRQIRHKADLPEAAAAVGFPCVVKPLDGGGGRGVTADINDHDSLEAAYDFARGYSQNELLVEAHVAGMDHRLMTVDGRFIAAIRRQAASVTGDGEHTIDQLIAKLNAGRFRNMPKSRYMRPINIDDVLLGHLAHQGFKISDKPAASALVSLRSNANLSTGGCAVDVTRQTHPEVREMAEQVALSFGLGTAGLDYLTSDITLSPAESGGMFIELNTTPGLDACVAAGWQEEEIARVVLGEEPGYIPVDLVLLPYSALKQQIQQLKNASLGSDEGWVCEDHLKVGQVHMQCTSSGPWETVNSALRNKRLRYLRIFCSPEDILRHGMPVDRLQRLSMEDVSLPEDWQTVCARALQERH